MLTQRLGNPWSKRPGFISAVALLAINADSAKQGIMETGTMQHAQVASKLNKTRYRPLQDATIAGPQRCHVPTGDCFHWSIHYIHQANQPISVWMGEVPTRKHPKWQYCTSNCESHGRFWIRKFKFLFAFHSNHNLVSEVFAYDRQTDGQYEPLL